MNSTRENSKTSPLQVRTDDGIATIQLSRPPLNPFDTTMRDALITAVRAVSDDDDVRVCVIHGGTENFCAGADIAALAAMGYEEIVTWNARLHAAFTAVSKLSCPVIAAVNGYALGGGFELALAADLRIGSQSARVGLPEVRLGILPGSGGTQRLTRIVGRSTAKLLMMTGRHVEAAEALRLGVFDELTDSGETLSRAYELAEMLTAIPRHAARAIKECVDAAEPLSETGFALERASLAGLFATNARNTAMAEFLARHRDR